MIRSLSFKVEAPQPYHTFGYHQKKAFKEGYMGSEPDPKILSKLIRHSLDGLIALFEIPAGFDLILLQDKKLLLKTLANVGPGTISVAGSTEFADNIRFYNNKVTFLDDHAIDLSSGDVGEKPLIIQDIDPVTGQKAHLNNRIENLDYSALSFTHLDISCSSPTDPLDFEKIQSFSFATRYGFGMSQDLVVWILKSDLFDMLVKQLNGMYLEFDPGSSKTKKCFVQDNVEIDRIYILGMIVQDFLNRGLTLIRNEIKYKSIILYNSINDNPNLKPLINDPKTRSLNIICAKTEIANERILNFMSDNRIEFDVLARQDTSSIIRIANYPVHSKEQMEYLADLIVKL
jgi:phosphoserine aminotransferase